MNMSTKVTPTESTNWPEPKPLESTLLPVEQLREGLLPDSIRSRVLDVVERMQVPLDYPAATLLVMLGGAIGRRAAIQPKTKDTGWTEIPNLYGAIVAPPGALKSPTISTITKHIEEVEKAWYRKWAVEIAKWKKENKDKKREERDDPPKRKRLDINDATFEKIQEIMSENPLGLIVIRDELTGLLATFERNGHEGERQFYLTAWNGYTPYTIDRVGRGTIYVPHSCLSVFGGIQPMRLKEYLAGLSEIGASNDGMIQRFQLLVFPDMPPDWTYFDEPLNLAAQRQVQGIFDRILKLEPAEPIRYVFSSDAQKIFVSWLEQLEHRIRGNDLAPSLAGHLGKYRGLMPSLALIFEMAERGASKVGVVGCRPGAHPPTVSAGNASLAIQWCRYLESHARRVYSIFDPETFAAQKLASRIKERVFEESNSFTCRDVQQKNWTGLRTTEEIRAALKLLHSAGWVRPIEKSSKPNGGRPSERYEVNPKVWDLKESRQDRRTDMGTYL